MVVVGALSPSAFSGPLHLVEQTVSTQNARELEADQLFDELTGHSRARLRQKDLPPAVRRTLEARFVRERAHFLERYEQISPIRSADDFNESKNEILELRRAWEASTGELQQTHARELRDALQFAIITTWKRYRRDLRVQQSLIDAQKKLPERERSTLTLASAEARRVLVAWTFHRRKQMLSASAGQDPFTLYTELDPFGCQDLLAADGL